MKVLISELVIQSQSFQEVFQVPLVVGANKVPFKCDVILTPTTVFSAVSVYYFHILSGLNWFAKSTLLAPPLPNKAK